MRELKPEEIQYVSGAGNKGCSCYCDDDEKKKQGNNGYGNGGHDGVPGNSGKSDKKR